MRHFALLAVAALSSGCAARALACDPPNGRSYYPPGNGNGGAVYEHVAFFEVQYDVRERRYVLRQILAAPARASARVFDGVADRIAAPPWVPDRRPVVTEERSYYRERAFPMPSYYPPGPYTVNPGAVCPGGVCPPPGLRW